MKIGRWDFEGPYDENQLADRPGIYVVLDKNSGGSSYSCIDVGESDEVATRIWNHDRKQCWTRNTDGLRVFAVLYTDDDDDRRKIERRVRELTSPPCGAF